MELVLVSGITQRDHVDAVVAAIDRAEVPVLLVAHSAGSGLAHAAVDARPDRVSRVHRRRPAGVDRRRRGGGERARPDHLDEAQSVGPRDA